MKDQGDTRAAPSTPDGDGVRITGRDGHRSRPVYFYTVLAVALVAAGIGWLALKALAPDADAARAQDPAQAAAAQDAPATGLASLAAPPPPPGQGGRPATDDLAQFIPPGQEPPMAEVIDRLHKAGVRSGIGAFNPPGTSPPLVGLAVPEDYVLPEGYVRHFQATDDGQRIEPILMYSPDFDFVDETGRPIPVPPDRVVPPELAPPGLPIRRIEVPPALRTPRGP